MKTTIGGNGQDTTSTVMAWLAAHKDLRLANLYLIGEADDPAAVWLTDYESPLLWSPWGTFQSSVIKRGTVTSKIGLEVESLELTWSPKNDALTASVATASPYQLARLGYFDNKRVRVWRCFMPTPGDANTFGAMELFGGFVGEVQPTRGSIKFTVNSYLYVLNQKVPSGVIEVTNTLASYSGGAPPYGFSVVPQWTIVTGSNTNVLLADQTYPTAMSVPVHDTLNDDFVIFNGGAGSTLQGAYSIIGRNQTFTDGHGVHHAQIYLYAPLPWAPTPGVDTFYILGRGSLNLGDAGYLGFPYVPSPETAL